MDGEIVKMGMLGGAIGVMIHFLLVKFCSSGWYASNMPVEHWGELFIIGALVGMFGTCFLRDRGPKN